MIPHPESVRPFYIVATVKRTDDADPPPVPSPELLIANGASSDEISALAGRPSHTAIISEAPLAQGMQAERTCRRAAFALAVDHDGVVIDASIPRVLGMQRSYPRLTAATNWFLFQRDGAQVSTVGLRRFGLPELTCREGEGPMFDAVLTGLAQRILRDWPSIDPVGPQTVTVRDIAYGYGDRASGGEDPTFARALDLTVSYAGDDDVLEVTVLDDPSTTLFVD